MAYTNPDAIHDFGSASVSHPTWGQAMNDGTDAIWAGLKQTWAHWDVDVNKATDPDATRIQSYCQRIGYEAFGWMGLEVVDAAALNTIGGDLTFDLPYSDPPETTPMVIGKGGLYDASAGVWHSVVALIETGAVANAGGKLVHHDPATNGGLCSNAAPFVWALGDKMVLDVHYRLDSNPGTGLLV